MPIYNLHRIHIRKDKTPRKAHLLLGLVISVPLYILFIHLNLRTSIKRHDEIEYFTSANATKYRASLGVTRPASSVSFLAGGVAPHNFSYIIKNEKLCASQNELTFFMYVLSSPKNVENRMNIRKTWGNISIFKQHSTRLAFMLGSPSDAAVQEQIAKEQQTYGDIVQQDFIDSYKNVTFKGIMALSWITEFCRNTKIILKFDDDVIVDIFGLMKFIEEHTKSARRTFYCKVDIDYKIERDVNHKYYVSQDQYQLEVAPPRCIGPGWIVTGDIIPELYNASFTAPFVAIEDIYTTGILPILIKNVTHAFWHAFGDVNELESSTMKALQRYNDIKQTLPVVAAVPIDVYFEIWDIILSRLQDRDFNDLNIDSKVINTAESYKFKKLAVGLM